MENKRILFYVHYNKKNKLSDHVVYQIKKLRPIFSQIVFISNSNLGSKDRLALSKYIDKFIQRENKGYDFAGWRDGILSLKRGEIRKFDSVTIMNDTCFGPLYDMGKIYEKMERRDVDFWGMTDHTFTETGMPGTDLCIPRHIQSYFISFSRKVVESKEFDNFWRSVIDYKDVFKVIQDYETKLTGLLEKAGFKSATLIETEKYTKQNKIDTPNYSEMQPLITIEEGVPLVKVKSFTWTPRNKIESAIRKHSKYPVRLIKKHTSDMNVTVPKKRRFRLFIIENIKKNKLVHSIFKKIYRSIISPKDDASMKKINIIVPVYADWSSLNLNISSLSKFYGNKDWVKVYYIDDCGPESSILEQNIRKSIKKYHNFKYFKNNKNLGFVKNNNNAVNNIIEKSGDILLLNSDTKVTNGFLEEIISVAYSDDKIGIVNPRSNNATIWSVPMNGSMAINPKKSYSQWKKLKKVIPQKYICPTSHGFCMFIKRKVVDELGLFDEIYGKGYGEENDFTMRAMKHGWKCAAANYAFVFHYESKSFGDAERLRLSNINRRILDERYPEYTKLLNDYLDKTNEIVPKKDTILWKITKKIFFGMDYVHNHGYKEAVRGFSRFIKRRFIKNNHSGQPAIRVWTNELTNSGAPIVLASVLDDMINSNSDKFLASDIKIFYPYGCRIHRSYVNHLIDLGLNPEPDSPASRNFNVGDVILLNSSGYDNNLYNDILKGLENRVVKHLYFYIHEDSPFWTGMDDAAYLTVKGRFKALLDEDKITIYVPSKMTMDKWINFFDTSNNFFVMPGRTSLKEADIISKNVEDFDMIRFIVSGTVEPRKMQLSILGAFDCFNSIYFNNNINKYRDWKLDIIGTYDNEPMNIYNNNVKKYDGKINGRISIHDKMPIDKALSITKDSNVTITYSSDESYSMVTIEGMVFGHPIIRSEASGVDEQLKPGINGFQVETTDLYTLVSAVEEILNKDKTSTKKLVSMSKMSNKIALGNINSKYKIISDIEKEFGSN